MREIKERQNKKKVEKPAPVYNNIETLKREQRILGGAANKFAAGASKF